MKLEIHPEAEKHFNCKAEELVAHIQPWIEPERGPALEPPDLHIAVALYEDEISDFEMSLADYFGKQKAKFFEYENKMLGLNGEGYQSLKELAVAICKKPGFRDALSLQWIIDLIFRWVGERYKGLRADPFIPHLLKECERSISTTEIWTPIARTCVISPLQLGRITLQPITKQMIDQSEAKALQLNPDKAAHLQRFFDQLRQETQGYAAAVISIEAESEKAQELAFEATEEAIDLLRCFSPANLHPDLTSLTVPLGSHHFRLQQQLIMEDGLIRNRNTRSLDDPRPWVLDDDMVLKLRGEGLDTASGLLLIPDKTPFQENVLEALRLYSKSSLAKSLSEKLIYILAPLESLLLKDEQEPVGYSLRDRFALMVGRTLRERKEIAALIGRIYRLRSQFLHHAQEVTDSDKELLREFMFQAWFFFTLILENINRCSTLEQFIRAIDDMKYKGGLRS